MQCCFRHDIGDRQDSRAVFPASSSRACDALESGVHNESPERKLPCQHNGWRANCLFLMKRIVVPLEIVHTESFWVGNGILASRSSPRRMSFGNAIALKPVIVVFLLAGELWQMMSLHSKATFRSTQSLDSWARLARSTKAKSKLAACAGVDADNHNHNHQARAPLLCRDRTRLCLLKSPS
jgi:hypothetical protein